VNLDDNIYVYENVHVQRGLTWGGVEHAFRAVTAGMWQPLTTLSLMADVSLFGPQPAGHHLANLIFHVLNTLLLFGVLRAMTGSLWRSAFVASLFAVHPLHVESVAW